jgi:polyhydroxyalkanoate synthesis regulator phasin
MVEIFEKITTERFFNTLTNNCQEKVKSILDELVKNGNLSRLSLDELKEENEITFIFGW